MQPGHMFIDMRKSIVSSDGAYNAGTTYVVDESRGADWIRCGFARETRTPPAHIVELLSRLDEGAGQPCLFLPFVSEFGHEIMTHIRIVHFNRAARKVVCCRPGNEVLYPSADEHVTDWTDPLTDVERATALSSDLGDFSDVIARYPGHHVVKSGGLDRDQALWSINPTERIPFRPKVRGLSVDVLLGVRHRQLAPDRNWHHWQAIGEALTANGYTFAVVGSRETSFDVAGQVLHTGDHDTDATIELMRNCALWVGSDTGSSHLASTVGCRMLLIHPRPVASSYIPRMTEVNPGRIDFVAGGWQNPQRVIDRMLATLRETTAGVRS